MRVVLGIGRLRREHRHRHLLPVAVVGAAPPELRAEMPEIERGVGEIAIGQHRGHRLAEKIAADDVPPAAAPRDLEEALARPDIQPLRYHSAPPQPPVSAWNT